MKDNSEPFYVGQYVRIREWNDMANEFEERDGTIKCRYTFLPEMRFLCGRTARITAMHNNSNRKIDLEDWNNSNGTGSYFFSTDMICPIEWGDVLLTVL